MIMIDGNDSMADAFDFLNSFSESSSSLSSFVYEERKEYADLQGYYRNSATTASPQSGPAYASFRTMTPSNSQQVRPKSKKKRKPAETSQESYCLIPARIPLPRILKSDIRRQYGTMFANVFNTGEYNFMLNFLETFVRPDYLYIMKKIGVPDPIVTIVGKPKLAEYWYQRMHDAPDLLFSIDQSKLKIRSDKTAVFSTRFAMKGTIIIGNEEQQKVYDAKISDVHCTGQVYDTQVEDLHNPNTNSSGSMSVSDTSSINGIDEDIVDALLDDPIQKIHKEVNGDQAVKVFEPKIIDYLVQGVISMHLDSDCRLAMLEMIIYQDNNKKGTA